MIMQFTWGLVRCVYLTKPTEKMQWVVMDLGDDTERALVEMPLLNNKVGHMQWVMRDLGEDAHGLGQICWR